MDGTSGESSETDGDVMSGRGAGTRDFEQLTHLMDEGEQGRGDTRQGGCDTRQGGDETCQEGDDTCQQGVDTSQGGGDTHHGGVDTHHGGSDTRQESDDDTIQGGNDTRQESGDDIRQVGDDTCQVGDDTCQVGDDTCQEAGDNTRQEMADGYSFDAVHKDVEGTIHDSDTTAEGPVIADTMMEGEERLVRSESETEEEKKSQQDERDQQRSTSEDVLLTVDKDSREHDATLTIATATTSLVDVTDPIAIDVEMEHSEETLDKQSTTDSERTELDVENRKESLLKNMADDETISSECTLDAENGDTSNVPDEIETVTSEQQETAAVKDHLDEADEKLVATGETESTEKQDDEEPEKQTELTGEHEIKAQTGENIAAEESLLQVVARPRAELVLFEEKIMGPLLHQVIEDPAMLSTEEIMEETGTREEIMEETGTREEIVKDTGTREIMEETGTREEIVEETGTREEIMEETGTREEIVEETGIREEIIEETGTREEIVKDTGTRKEIMEETGTTEEISKETGTTEENMEETGTTENNPLEIRALCKTQENGDENQPNTSAEISTATDISHRETAPVELAVTDPFELSLISIAKSKIACSKEVLSPAPSSNTQKTSAVETKAIDEFHKTSGTVLDAQKDSPIKVERTDKKAASLMSDSTGELMEGTAVDTKQECVHHEDYDSLLDNTMSTSELLLNQHADDTTSDIHSLTSDDESVNDTQRLQSTENAAESQTSSVNLETSLISNQLTESNIVELFSQSGSTQELLNRNVLDELVRGSSVGSSVVSNQMTDRSCALNPIVFTGAALWGKTHEGGSTRSTVSSSTDDVLQRCSVSLVASTDVPPASSKTSRTLQDVSGTYIVGDCGEHDGSYMRNALSQQGRFVSSTGDYTTQVQDEMEIIDDVLEDYERSVVTQQQRRVEIKTQPLQLSAPSLQLSAPSLQLSAPSLQLSAPSLQLSAPSLQLSAPSLQLSDPSLQLSAPSLQLSAPSLQLSAPSLQLSAPSLQLSAPSLQNSATRSTHCEENSAGNVWPTREMIPEANSRRLNRLASHEAPHGRRPAVVKRQPPVMTRSHTTCTSINSTDEVSVSDGSSDPLLDETLLDSQWEPLEFLTSSMATNQSEASDTRSRTQLAGERDNLTCVTHALKPGKDKTMSFDSMNTEEICNYVNKVYMISVKDGRESYNGEKNDRHLSAGEIRQHQHNNSNQIIKHTFREIYHKDIHATCILEDFAQLESQTRFEDVYHYENDHLLHDTKKVRKFSI